MATEGGFYLWDKAESDQVVGEDAEIVGFIFGVQPDGNVPPRHDAHGEMTGKVSGVCGLSASCRR